MEDHGEAVEAHAEGEAGDLLGVEEGVATRFADGSEDGGIDHAAAGDFDPAGFFALGFELHIDLEAGLGEGEEVRAEADGGAGAEDFAEEELQRAFEVGEGDVFIDVKCLDLVKDAEVGGVDLIAAVGGTGGDDADGQGFHGLHGADLHAGGVGAEELAIGHVEGVALVAGGVIGGRVQRVEAMPLGLDFGAIGEREAHAAEGAHGEIADLGERMECANTCAGAAREAEIDARDGFGVFGVLQGFFAAGELARDGIADFVELGTDFFFQIDRHITHPGAEGGELAFFAQVVDAEGLQRGFIRQGGEGGEGFGFEGVELCNH